MRKYDPKPPPTGPVDSNSFELKLAKLKVEGAGKGWAKYKVTLSNEIRALHLTNPIHADDWRALIQDFDAKFLCTGYCFVWFWFVSLS